MNKHADNLRRTRADMLGTDDEEHYGHCHDAADEIERLSAENSRLEASCANYSEKAVNRLKRIEQLEIVGEEIAQDRNTANDRLSEARKRITQLEAALQSESSEGERLKAELAKHQESEFHPDWSMLKATRSSLREHQSIIRELREAMTTMRKLAGKGSPIDNVGKFAMKARRGIMTASSEKQPQ